MDEQSSHQPEHPPEHHQPPHEGSVHHAAAPHTGSPHQAGMKEMPKVDFSVVTPKAFTSGLSDIIGMLTFNKKKMEEVANRDQEGVALALVFLILGALAAALGGMILGYNIPLLGTIRLPIGSGITTALVAVVGAALILCLMQQVAEKLFQVKNNFSRFLRVMGYCYFVNVVGFLTIIPFIAMLGGLWYLAMVYLALTSIHKMTPVNAILTIVVTVVVAIIVIALLGTAGLSSLLSTTGGFNLSNFSLNY